MINQNYLFLGGLRSRVNISRANISKFINKRQLERGWKEWHDHIPIICKNNPFDMPDSVLYLQPRIWIHPKIA